MNFTGLRLLPSQKKAHKEKNKTWRKDCVNAIENMALFSDETLRKSRINKAINYNLYSDILAAEDVEKICNPLKLGAHHTPGKMQNYPLVNPMIDVLVGEEERRKFDFIVRTINQDAVSEKEKEINELNYNFVLEQIKRSSISEEDFNRKLASHKKYVNYEFQDKREQRATWILKHLWEKNNLSRIFNNTFKDALIAGEEIVQWDIIAGEPVCIKHNPKNVYTVRSGESPYIEDADIILIEGWYSPGKIIDEYHDLLSSTEITYIENYFQSGSTAKRAATSSVPASHLALQREVDDSIDAAIVANAGAFGDFSSPFDNDGNIRVLKVYWKSLRKMKKVKYLDPETGDELEDLQDENYIINPDIGESEEIIWINEWWEGHKIGASNSDGDAAIYTKMQPRPVQFRQMENPSKSHPGIVGTVYNTNDNISMSFMDRGKPYQYMYNSLMYNTELTIATNWGKIMRIPLHEVPDGWDTEKWLYFGRIMKAVPFDAFKESKKGVSTGKIAGLMNQSNLVLDLELSNTIQLYVSMLQYIEQSAYKALGMSPQRMGAISNRETVGGVERAVDQSSLSTEYWFAEHDFFKKRVLQVGLETAKVAWKNKKNIKKQFVLDDMTSQIFEFNGDEFAEIDYDITISSSYTHKQAYDALRQEAQSALQSGVLNYSQFADILTSDSMAAIKRKLQVSEQEKIDYENKKMEMQKELQNQQLKAAAEEKQRDRDFEMAKLDKEFQNEVTLEEIKARMSSVLNKQDADRDGIPDVLELNKLENNKEIKQMDIEATREENDKQRSFEKEENAKDRTASLKEKRISKPKSTK